MLKMGSSDMIILGIVLKVSIKTENSQLYSQNRKLDILLLITRESLQSSFETIQIILRYLVFMKRHRVVLALQALSFCDLAITRKSAIIAFSNYLAFNANARRSLRLTLFDKLSSTGPLMIFEPRVCRLRLTIHGSFYISIKRRLLFA